MSVGCDGGGMRIALRSDDMLLFRGHWLLVAQQTGLASQVHEGSQPEYTKIY